MFRAGLLLFRLPDQLRNHAATELGQLLVTASVEIGEHVVVET
jgi:hypothetical protein